MVYVGIDLHRKRSYVDVVGEDGAECSTTARLSASSARRPFASQATPFLCLASRTKSAAVPIEPEPHDTLLRRPRTDGCWNASAPTAGRVRDPGARRREDHDPICIQAHLHG